MLTRTVGIIAPSQSQTRALTLLVWLFVRGRLASSDGLPATWRCQASVAFLLRPRFRPKSWARVRFGEGEFLFGTFSVIVLILLKHALSAALTLIKRIAYENFWALFIIYFCNTVSLEFLWIGTSWIGKIINRGLLWLGKKYKLWRLTLMLLLWVCWLKLEFLVRSADSVDCFWFHFLWVVRWPCKSLCRLWLWFASSLGWSWFWFLF